MEYIKFRYTNNYKGVKFATIKGIEFLKIPIKQVKHIRKIFSLFNLEENTIGVYLLYNYEKIPELYIGEGFPITRIEQHNKDDQKDFYSEILIMFKDGMDKTLAQEVEKQLIEIFREDLYNVEIYNGKGGNNTNAGRETILSAKESISTFKEYAEIFDLKIIEEKITEKKIIEEETKGEIFYCENNRGAKAKGYFSNGGIIVLEGSIFSKETVNSFRDYNKKQKQDLIEKDILIEINNKYKLTKNYFFKSPSMASSIILGNPSNGWSDWKNKEGKTLDDIYRKIN